MKKEETAKERLATIDFASAAASSSASDRPSKSDGNANTSHALSHKRTCE